MAITVLITFFLVVLIALAWAALSSGADRTAAGPSADSRAQRSEVASRATAPDHCRSAREGLAFYRGRYSDWRALRAAATPYPVGRKPTGCADARQLAKVWKGRAFTARRITNKWLEDRLLRDHPFCSGCSAWQKAVREVQRVFPGTESWLLSCSAAEGGHGRWVGYGGQGYSTGLRDSDTVGGPLQFRYSTFKGMYRRARAHALDKGFRVGLRSDLTAAWRSALGQALAGAWARYTGNDNSHWSASFGRGC